MYQPGNPPQLPRTDDKEEWRKYGETVNRWMWDFSKYVYSMSAIKSVQDVSITIASATANNTATITGVVTSKAYVILRGFNVGTTTTDPKNYQPILTLTNSTTVTASLSGVAPAGGIIVAGTVIEFA